MKKLYNPAICLTLFCDSYLPLFKKPYNEGAIQNIFLKIL